MATGIMGFLDWAPEERDRQELAFEERRKREALEAAKAAEVAAYEAEVREIYDKIEAAVLPFIHDAASAVNSATRTSPADRKIFEQFKHYCSTWNPALPALPAHPAAVAAFLIRELDRGVAHFMKRLHALVRVHRSVGLKDPSDDVLLKSLVLTVKTSSNQKEKVNHANL